MKKPLFQKQFRGLFALILLVILSVNCAGRSGGDKTVSGLPEELSGGVGGIALSMDPTEVALIELEPADTLRAVVKGDYVIGIDDKLEISIFARNFTEDTDAEEVTVRDDGKIYISLLGEMQAAGQSINGLREEIALRARPFVKDPFILVTVTEYNSQRATIFGEIGGGSGSGGGGGGGRAIKVPLEGPTRMVDLLSTTVLTSGDIVGNISASPRLEADLSNIILTRRTGERFRVNLNTYLFGLDTAANIEVFDGDLIFVPRFENNRVFVMGEVSTPGVVPIGLGLTATEAIARSGGFTNIARRNDVKLVRGGIENPSVIEVPVWKVAKKGHREEDVPLRNGDILFIPRSPIGSLNILLTQIIPPLQTWLLIQAISN